MIGLSTWESIIFVIVVILAINYIVLIAHDRLTGGGVTTAYTSTSTFEGFEDAAATTAITAADNTTIKWLHTDDIYDDFYASIHDKLTQHTSRLQSQVAMLLHEWSQQIPKDQMVIMDGGSGTGVVACQMAKDGVGQIIAVDKSPAMMRYAQKTILPATTLTETQRQNIDWRQSDLLNPSTCRPAELSHAALFYFTIYYIRDIDTLFKNLFTWIKPGGHLMVEVVNKYKFEAVLDSSNPWVAFSPQKYAKERITKSKVAFDKFDYEAEFDLEDPRAEFKEVFHFKDGSKRHHKHVLWMPSIENIIQRAKENGFEYKKYIEMTPFGFPYAYMLMFRRSPLKVA